MNRLILFALAAQLALAGATLRVAYFQADVTPPPGAPLCFALVDPVKRIDDPLTARGVVLRGVGKPIVLAAVDWLGIGNGGFDRWRSVLAAAAGTAPGRVVVHTLHQHDAPGYDETAERFAAEAGLAGRLFHPQSARDAIGRTAKALREAKSQPVTHVGWGKAAVERVASNRRILGADGKVKYGRMSSSRIPEAIAAPEGVIDADVQLFAFWNGDRPIVALTYYATHPQSHYGKGGVSWEFVGSARAIREQSGIPQVHFNGASGNVAAGKYNDGTPERRPELAGRLADGMRRAWEDAARQRVEPTDAEWRTTPVALPVTRRETIDQLRLALHDQNRDARSRLTAARHLAWHTLRSRGRTIDISLLRIGGPTCSTCRANCSSSINWRRGACGRTTR
jgi:hypothetical protein